jgi:hypothetical protein
MSSRYVIWQVYYDTEVHTGREPRPFSQAGERLGLVANRFRASTMVLALAHDQTAWPDQGRRGIEGVNLLTLADRNYAGCGWVGGAIRRAR